jgi:tetratricopeptide (TPR) repeat protein
LVGVRRGWCTPLRIEFSPAPLQPSAAGVELRTRLESIFAESGEDAARLRRFLELAVVCGEVAPSLPLMAAVGFSQVDAERCVDLIDDHLCGHDDALALFEDLAYRHPGFPGLSVYRFANAQTRALVREQIEPAVLANAAQELWTFLSTRLGVATRSVAQLFANLALPAQPDRAAGPLQRLRLWVGGGEVEALQDLLADDVRAGRLPAEALFSAAQRDASMPAHQRLALLEAASVEIAVECGAASARADGSAPRSDGPAGPASAVATSDGAEASAGASTPRENAVEQVAGGGAALDVNGASADGGGSLRDRASVAAGGGGASTDRNAPAAIDRALATAVLRTELLCALGKFGPALESADAAQRLLATQPSEPPGVKGLLLFLTANCRRRLGQLDQALAAFRAAADEASRPRPDGSVDHHNIGVCLAESGHCHAERAEWPEAIRLLDEALNLLKQSDPDNQLHREQVAQLERNLAVCQTKLAEAHAH